MAVLVLPAIVVVIPRVRNRHLGKDMARKVLAVRQGWITGHAVHRPRVGQRRWVAVVHVADLKSHHSAIVLALLVDLCATVLVVGRVREDGQDAVVASCQGAEPLHERRAHSHIIDNETVPIHVIGVEAGQRDLSGEIVGRDRRHLARGGRAVEVRIGRELHRNIR